MPPSGWYKEFMSGYGFEIGAYKPEKRRPPPIPTLGELFKNQPRWVWLTCTNGYFCQHRAAMPLAPLIIRWGENASSDKLRRCARCSRCGAWGAYTHHPSVASLDGVMYGPFPVEQRAAICREKL